MNRKRIDVPLGQTQLRVMQYLWEHGPATVREVHAWCNARKGAEPRNYNTHLTVMRALARRGVLSQSCDGVGKAHQFAVVDSRDAYVSQVVRDVCKDYFDGDATAFLQAVRALAGVKTPSRRAAKPRGKGNR